MNIGVPEMLFILILALLIFGPKKLPEVGRTIGKGLGEFRRASNDLKRTIEREIDESEVTPPPPMLPLASVSRGERPQPPPPVIDAAPQPAVEPGPDASATTPASTTPV